MWSYLTGFSKWHSQQVVEIQFIRLGVCTYTNEYLFLVHIDKKGALDSIPDGKNGTVICVSFFYITEWCVLCMEGGTKRSHHSVSNHLGTFRLL